MNEKTPDDGERQGQADSKAGALPPGGLNIDHAVNPFNVIADDIHPDSAAGNIADLLGCGEAGPENKPQCLILSHPAGLFCRNDALPQSRLCNQAGVDPGSVVLDDQDDLVVLVGGNDAYGSGLAFAGLAADFRGLYAVIDGIAQQMDQRVAKLLNERPVQLRLFAFKDQLNLLVQEPDKSRTMRGGD